ncbi:MAG: hypothetical protein JWN13_2248 [Betaproteobacteria bacterium]|nr:hypothetical protein [Betaproteobacteria bacterium]
MRKTLIGLLFVTWALLGAGCTTAVKQEPWTAKIVTARAVVSADDVRGITNTFTREGRIYVHAAFTGPASSSAAPHPMQIKWFNGNALVFERAAEHAFSKSPFYVWAGTSGTALGVGNCRVELYADGQLVGMTTFTVTKK